MKIHREFEPNSIEWLECRAGKLTASEAKSLFTPKLSARKGEMPRTLLATKLAERWIGPMPGFSAWATEQGHFLEESAIPCFEFEYGQTVDRVGFISTDDGLCGCSPDGILGDTGLEIKSLQPTHHVSCLIDGGVPEEFLPQIHFGMFVTGFQQWKLFLYSRRFPRMLLTIDRDDEIQETIQSTVESFMTDLEIEYQRLIDRNGGPPPKRKVFVPSPESEDNPYVDITP